MFDITTLVKQDDTNRKINLLKQIKISIESLMFESKTRTSNKWQNVGVLSMLSRHILTILEDGLILNYDSNLVMSCSPSIHSRTTTFSSLGASELNTDLDQTLWNFITIIFTSDNQKPNIVSNDFNLEYIARKDFESIYNQIKLKENDTLNHDSIDMNFSLNWIKTSLRQNLLLNQLVYLSSDSSLIEKFYHSNAFLLDRTYVNDFLSYIKASETRDHSILKKIKCKFFSPSHETSKSPVVSSNQDKLNYRSSPSSHTSSITSQTNQAITNGYNNYITTDMTSSPTSSINLTNSENNSLLEQAINDLNISNKLKQSHRRMHSFPNIQINEIKRKTLTTNSSNLSNGSLCQSFQLNGDLDSNCNKDNDSFMSSPKLEESNLENQLSTSTLLLNNQIEDNLTKLNDNDLNNNTSSSNANVNNPSEIYEKTTVFDFIHSQQINCDCNQVDKENSHFIIADISIAAFELIKTQDLDDLTQLDYELLMNSSANANQKPPNESIHFLTVTKPNTKRKPVIRPQSNVIRINRIQSNLLLNAFNMQECSPLNGTFVSGEDYASSVEREVFFASNCTSPNPEILSSDVILKAQPKRGHKKSLSSVTQLADSDDKIKILPPKAIFKSFSSNNLTTNEVKQEENEVSQWPTTTTSTTTLRNDQIIFELTDNTSSPKNNITLSSSPISSIEIKSSNSTSIASKILNRNMSTNTISSQMSTRTRRFSWEEIVNLDTAEHIANRLIEKLIETENHQRKKHDSITNSNQRPIQIPNLKQFEIFIQLLEFLEYMQIYFEIRSSGILHKCIQELALNNARSIQNQLNMSASSMYLSHSESTNNKQTNKNSQTKINNLLNLVSKSFEKAFKSSIMSKIKIAAVASAATVSIRQLNLEKQKSIDTQDDLERKDNLIKQISLNIQDTNSLDAVINSESFTNEDLMNKSITSSTSIALSNNIKTLNSRILGDESWAPVRDQLILNLTSKMKRLDQMILQNFRCADCGIQVRKDKMKSFNYCEYFCKYFCRCCHINNQSYIPAYIVNNLDFRTKYEVSKKAKNFLEKIYNEPVITLESLNPSLYERNNIFSRFKKVRFKLYNCRHYINSCRFAIDLKKQVFNQFDDFIINDTMVYSIETLFKIKQTNYYEVLKQLVQFCMDHIRSCELCSQQGYICGLCTNNEFLYPFDLDKVQKCDNCLACCHKTCLKKPDLCPRCKRKQNRMRLNSSNANTISVSND